MPIFTIKVVRMRSMEQSTFIDGDVCISRYVSLEIKWRWKLCAQKSHWHVQIVSSGITT